MLLVGIIGFWRINSTSKLKFNKWIFFSKWPCKLLNKKILKSNKFVKALKLSLILVNYLLRLCLFNSIIHLQTTTTAIKRGMALWYVVVVMCIIVTPTYLLFAPPFRVRISTGGKLHCSARHLIVDQKRWSSPV